MSGTMNKCLNGPDEEKSLYFIPTVSSVSEFAKSVPALSAMSGT
jgi:hypothetical protein